MSVAYESTRAFIHDGAYCDEDHQRYTDDDVAEHLGHYTADGVILADDDVPTIISDDDDAVQDATRIDLTSSAFPSPVIVPLSAPSMTDEPLGSKEPSPGIGSPCRNKALFKPDRDVTKQPDGKYHCTQPDCKEEVRAFSRKCEWNKHMDKHERPYRCPAEGCENLPGFTYSGGLLRHEREVHGKHGGPRNTVNCPHPNCKRHKGKGFSRMENLNEHLRRVHTHLDGVHNHLEGGSTPPPAESVAGSPEDNESDRSAAAAAAAAAAPTHHTKRKRRLSDDGGGGGIMTDIPVDELGELRDENSRLRDEVNCLRDDNNCLRDEMEKVKAEIEQQTQHSLAMMTQIAELQDALRHGLVQHGLGAPTAQMN
ncbi:hypothetical protein CP533_0546 [Ophiocordyceps camponoti-saundersi (nom. inval.)]|nr:hypothetical protein CP533_0546 [Ophiocordyceps camponoti-saundersi (nom. inval.)]